MADESQPKMIKIDVGKGVDKRLFEVPEDIACMSTTIKNLLDAIPDDDDDEPIPLPNTSPETFQRILDFLELHRHDAPMSEEQRREWKTRDIEERDKPFVDIGDDITPLYELICQANALDIRPLIDVAAKALGQFIKTRTPEQIKQFMGIEGEFTAEEIAEAKREHEWLKDVTLPNPPAAKSQADDA
jgi:S-phase kinase-associated protein 1